MQDLSSPLFIKTFRRSIHVGLRVAVNKQDIPSIAPKGAHITTHTVTTDSNGKQVSCIEINFQCS